MSVLLDQPLGALLDAPPANRISPQLEALVVRIARLALSLGAGASATALTRVLATDSAASFLSAVADLLAAREASSAGEQAVLRGHLALAHALEQTGGLWRTDAAQKHLRVTRATLQAWRDDRKVLALPLDDRSFGYPVVQFAPAATDLTAPRPLPGLAEVLAAAGEALTPAELFLLLTTPQSVLGGRTGFAALAAGDTAPVVALVAHATTPADAGAPLA